jgi:hypothetical protein
MKKQIFIFTILAASLFLAGGCKKDHPVPPLERSELVLRFFRSIQQNRPQTAVQQGRKLEIHLYDKTVITSLIALQQSDSYLTEAQKALDKLDHAAAVKTIKRGLKQYPGNRALQEADLKLKQLKPLPQLFADMENAKSAPAMSAAVTAASASLGSYMTPETEKYFVRYRAKIARQLVKENKQLQEPLNIPDNVFED